MHQLRFILAVWLAVQVGSALLLALPLDGEDSMFFLYSLLFNLLALLIVIKFDGGIVRGKKKETKGGSI